MKTLGFLAVLAVLLTTLGAGIQDYLSEMKTTVKGVEGFVQDNIGYGNFAYPSACARIPNARRAAIVRAAGEFARSFTTTAAFTAWYNEMRDQRKPSPPTPTIAIHTHRSRASQASNRDGPNLFALLRSGGSKLISERIGGPSTVRS